MLLLQKSGIHFPAPTSYGLKLAMTPVVGNPVPAPVTAAAALVCAHLSIAAQRYTELKIIKYGLKSFLKQKATVAIFRAGLG